MLFLKFNPNELMQVLDDMPSGEDSDRQLLPARPLSPEPKPQLHQLLQQLQQSPVKPQPPAQPDSSALLNVFEAEQSPIKRAPKIATSRIKGRVENTPPVNPNAIRYCSFCPGQVRPQMCGGNKHRWRCVDKRCRKWYGWVKSNDVIPHDLGKKGRWKDLVIRVQSSTNEFEDRLASEMISNTGDGDDNAMYTLRGGGDDNGGKRRYKRRAPSREVSPLNTKQACFHSSAMEQRARWWLSDRRRADATATRSIHTDSILQAASAFRVMGNALYTAASTRAQEFGAVNGALDLLLDSLLASMPPLLQMTRHLPGAKVPNETIAKMWESCTLHTPLG